MDVEKYTFFPTNATFSLRALSFRPAALLLCPRALLFRLQVRPFVMVNIIFQLLHVIHLPLEEKSMDKSVDRYRNLLNSIELYFANNEIACIILMKRQFQVKSSGFQVGDGKI